MVVKMPSQRSGASKKASERLAIDINLPVFTEPQLNRWPLKISWEDAVRSLTTLREHYMRNFDSPEKRLSRKNPEPFRL